MVSKTMKKFGLIRIAAAIVFLNLALANVSAQENSREDASLPPPAGVTLLRELDLTNAQIRQIRDINRQRQPANRAARERLLGANNALDEAVYADDFDEAEVEMRLREVQTAQAEMMRNRIATETAIRRILTPAQLVRFRELRAVYGRQTENRQNRVQNQRRKLPLRRLGNRRRPPQ